MIREWFATMNEILDELILRYPKASAEEKMGQEQQWNMLKSLSDDIIESWLKFEEKMASYRNLQEQKMDNQESEKILGSFTKGQGYFKLHMFKQASLHLEDTLAQYPDLVGARLYLAMCRMHLQEWVEAERHFKLIAAVTDENKLRAIAYNALGCVHAVYAHLEQAKTYFRKALDADPTFGDPKLNLESCQQGRGQLQLQFGSAELQSLAQA